MSEIITIRCAEIKDVLRQMVIAHDSGKSFFIDLSCMDSDHFYTLQFRIGKLLKVENMASLYKGCTAGEAPNDICIKNDIKLISDSINYVSKKCIDMRLKEEEERDIYHKKMELERVENIRRGVLLAYMSRINYINSHLAEARKRISCSIDKSCRSAKRELKNMARAAQQQILMEQL